VERGWRGLIQRASCRRANLDLAEESCSPCRVSAQSDVLLGLRRIAGRVGVRVC
jgi:hypothetical protein